MQTLRKTAKAIGDVVLLVLGDGVATPIQMTYDDHLQDMYR